MAQLIALTADELEALHGAGPLAVSVYLHLRAWMDYSTGVVGRTRPISLAMLAAYTETHTPRGAGTQIEQASERSIRTALDRLVRARLLHRLAGDRLTFALPMALTASARPEQTRHAADSDLSTARAPCKPSRRAVFGASNARHRARMALPNPTHLKNHVNQKPPQDQPAAVNKSAGAARRPQGLAEGEYPSPGSDSGRQRLIALGERRGMPPRPGESWQAFYARLMSRDHGFNKEMHA